MSEHPVKLVVIDDGERGRLAVFFRAILAIPLAIWFVLWSIATIVAVVIGWLAALATGRLPRGIHGFLARYIRFATHFYAYFWILADEYPEFNGRESYDVDIVLPDAPQRQSRLRILFRLPLAIPALIVASVLAGAPSWALYGRGGRRRSNSYSTGGSAGVLVAAGFLGWFASLFTGRMPRGLRDAGAYALGYRAQAAAYFLLVTDAYPNSDPMAMLDGVVSAPSVHPVRIVGDAHDLRRSRVTVFFRLPLAVPHIVWLVLWGIVAWLAAIVQWFVVWITGRPAASLHAFLSRYVRYALHVDAFLFLVANPFPGFAGEAGSYPLDLELPPPEPQGRPAAFFRLLLAVPAFVFDAALGGVLVTTAVFTWFYALVRGSAPWGLRNLAAYSLRYGSQVNAYLFFVTEKYPHASPLEGAAPEALDVAEAAA